MSESTPHSPIAVLGLGPMGRAIANALTSAGHRVRAWNRTPRTAAEHGLTGEALVELASSPGEAVAGARLIVVCVRDHTSSREVIATIPADQPAPVVVNVTTGRPTETVESARQASERGLRYVTGAVMVPTPMVGTDDCSVLYAGAADDVRALTPLMEALGGTSDVVGEDHAVPPALDLAMLDVYFAGMYAFLHSAALARAHGVDPTRYLPYGEGIVDTLRASLAGLADSMERRAYDGGEARLDMCLAFLEHLVTASREAGLEPAIAGLVRDASARAMTRWPGATDWDVVAEDLLPDREVAGVAG